MKKLFSMAMIALFLVCCKSPEPSTTTNTTTTVTDTASTMNQTTDTSGRRPDSLQRVISGIE